MTGVIWIVQLLVYPNFMFIESTEFKKFHHFHTSRISYIVAPVMLIELITAGALYLQDFKLFSFINLLLAVFLWLLTGFVSVPLHNKIQESFSMESVRSLIQTNRFRTALWTLKSLYWIYYLVSRGINRASY